MKVAQKSARPAPADRPVPAVSPDPGPDAAPAADNRAWFIALLVAGVLVLGATAVVAFGHTMPSWEQRVFTIINGATVPDWLTAQVARPISDAVYGIIALVGILLLVPRFRKRAWQYAVAGGAAYMLALILEHIVNRGRPADITNELITRASQGGPGFPSGHVSTLGALCLTVWLFVSWPWRIGLLCLIAAEAWSRVFLGVHAPLDVVGGIGVAAIVVAVLHLAPRKWRAFARLD